MALHRALSYFIWFVILDDDSRKGFIAWNSKQMLFSFSLLHSRCWSWIAQCGWLGSSWSTVNLSSTSSYKSCGHMVHSTRSSSGDLKVQYPPHTDLMFIKISVTERIARAPMTKGDNTGLLTQMLELELIFMPGLTNRLIFFFTSCFATSSWHMETV